MVKEIAVVHNMFADSVLENSWAHRSRRGWTTLTSFGMQFVVLGLVILLSILKSVVMPAVQTVSTPVFLSHVSSVPATSHSHVEGAPTTPASLNAMVYRRPSSLPIDKLGGGDEPSAPSIGDTGNGIFATGPPSPDGVLNDLFRNGTRSVPVPVPQPTPHPVFRRSNLLEGSILHRVQPVYPPLVRNARIQGSVVLVAIISKEGTIENLRLISGHPMLVQSAMDAVKQWRYRPYILNGDAIEVETQITINFYLGGN